MKLFAISNLILQYVMALVYLYHRAVNHSLCFGCPRTIVQRPVDTYSQVKRSVTAETPDAPEKSANKAAVPSQQIINL